MSVGGDIYMPAIEIGRVDREEETDELLDRLRLARTSTRGFPQNGRYYLGRDGLSVWLQRGPRAFSSTADLFVFLDKTDDEE